MRKLFKRFRKRKSSLFVRTLSGLLLMKEELDPAFVDSYVEAAKAAADK